MIIKEDSSAILFSLGYQKYTHEWEKRKGLEKEGGKQLVGSGRWRAQWWLVAVVTRIYARAQWAATDRWGPGASRIGRPWEAARHRGAA